MLNMTAEYTNAFCKIKIPKNNDWTKVSSYENTGRPAGNRSIHIIDTYKSILLWDDKIGRWNRRRLPGVGLSVDYSPAPLILLLPSRCIEIIDKIIKWLLAKSILDCCYRVLFTLFLGCGIVGRPDSGTRFWNYLLIFYFYVDVSFPKVLRPRNSRDVVLWTFKKIFWFGTRRKCRRVNLWS